MQILKIREWVFKHILVLTVRQLCDSTLAYLFERTGCAAMRCLDISASIMYKRSVFFWKINNSSLCFRESKW